MLYNQPFDQPGSPNAPYVNGNPGTGTQGSIPPAAAFEHPQRELVNVISKNGLTPSSGDTSQVAKGMQLDKIRYGVDSSSTASALIITLDPVPAAYQEGMSLRVKAAFSPTGATTINVNGLGAKTVLHSNTFGAIQALEWLPGSILELTFDGTNFLLTSVNEGRPVLNAARTYYVKAASPGSDSNDGLTAGTPFATWQHAIDVVKKLNLNGWTVTIQGLGGTYSVGATVSTPFFGGGTVIVQGTGDVISVSSLSAFYVINNAELSIGGGLTLSSSDASNGAVCAQFGGIAYIYNPTFNTCALYQIGALDGGTVRLRGNYNVTGGAQQHFRAEGRGAITVDTAAPITPTFSAVNYSSAFAFTQSISYMLLGSFNASAASVTGVRYSVQGNSVINVNGGGTSFLPGSSAGNTSTGGQYLP